MFGMSKTPNYWRANSEVAAYSSGPRSVLGEPMGSAANVYLGEGQLTSARTAFGFFPDTPAYLVPTPPPPCPEPEVETEDEDEEACDCIAEGEPYPEEGPGSDDEGQPKCGPVTIVIKPKRKK